MPAENPQTGELWEMVDSNGRRVRGIVAEIAPNVITLVSFTGNRMRMPPGRMTTMWTYVQPPPPTGLLCNARGCHEAGILRFQRGGTPEWVCARHLPVGVQASITTESLGVPMPAQPPQPTVQVRCPRCDRDDHMIEDIRLTIDEVRGWHCQACNDWSAMFVSPVDVQSTTVMAVRDFLVHAAMFYVAVNRIEVSRSIHRGLNRLLFNHGGSAETPENIMLYGIPVVLRDLPEGTWVFRLGGAPQGGSGGSEDLETRTEILARMPSTFLQASLNAASATDVARALREERARRERVDAHTFTEPEYVGTLPPPIELPVLPRTPTPEPPQEEPVRPLVSLQQRWVLRRSGDIVEVVSLAPAVDGTPMVHARRGTDETILRMQLEDFYNESVPYVPPARRAQTTAVPNRERLVENDEWENTTTGQTGVIESIDHRRELIILRLNEGLRRSVVFGDFLGPSAQWRKLIRRTAYERLLLDDELD